MAIEVREYERADRNDVQAACTDVVERSRDELRAEAATFQARVDVGVDERHGIRKAPVENRSAHLAVDEQLVAQLRRVVAHLYEVVHRLTVALASWCEKRVD